MKTRQWMQIAAVASALGLTGTAIANDADRTPATDTSAATMDNGVATTTDANAPTGKPRTAADRARRR